MIGAVLLACCLSGSSVLLSPVPSHSGSVAIYPEFFTDVGRVVPLRLVPGPRAAGDRAAGGAGDRAAGLQWPAGVNHAGYSPGIRGQVAGYRLAGIEPDGDPLDQVALKTRLSPSGGLPAVNLIVSSYLENFKPDTTPLLPDLLHPRQTARNLGGFLQGKALLTDDAGEVLYIGSFLAEAFLDNSNHAVMDLDGTGPAESGTAKLKGMFRLNKDGSLVGTFSGRISLPAAARRQLIEHRDMTMKPLTEILKTVTVVPAPMRGKATSGSPNAPLHTGFGAQPASTPQRQGLSIRTIVTGLGAVLCFLLAGILFWSSRRGRAPEAKGG